MRVVFGVVLRLFEGCFEKNPEAAIGLGEEDEMRASIESGRSIIDDHNWNIKKVQKIG